MALFRKEALEAKRQKLEGDVFLVQPIHHGAIAVILGLIVAVVGSLLFFGTYARTEAVPGYLVASRGLVRLHPHRAGILEEIRAAEGQRIEAGDILGLIKTSQSSMSGTTPEAAALDALNAHRALLESQIALLRDQTDSEARRLHAEAAAVAREINFLDAQLGLQRKITESARSAYEDVGELVIKGYVSKIESERRNQAWLAQQQQEQLLAQKLVAARSNLEQLEFRAGEVPLTLEQRTRQIKAELTGLDERQADIEGRTAFALIAPVAGTLASIRGTEGGTVTPANPVFILLPENSDLIAELYVPSRAMGFVETGQEVRILYDAFPYQRFGSHPAVIATATKTILAPGDLTVPFQIQQPVYKVTANLQHASVAARGKAVPLQNGMQLTANIVLERRSFLDWILDPIRSVGGRS